MARSDAGPPRSCKTGSFSLPTMFRTTDTGWLGADCSGLLMTWASLADSRCLAEVSSRSLSSVLLPPDRSHPGPKACSTCYTSSDAMEVPRLLMWKCGMSGLETSCVMHACMELLAFSSKASLFCTKSTSTVLSVGMPISDGMTAFVYELDSLGTLLLVPLYLYAW
ncbi:hypothetical protein Tco_0764678 [Tanacetum coccineum]